MIQESYYVRRTYIQLVMAEALNNSKTNDYCLRLSNNPSKVSLESIPPLSDISISRNPLANASYMQRRISWCLLVLQDRDPTASSNACVSSAVNVAQAAIKFSPRAESEASSLARATTVWLIPLIAAQLYIGLS